MITDRSIRIREGVWHVKEMTMTLANIQNIAVTRGPLQRLLGIADVKVMSAGGGSGAAGDPHGQGKAVAMHTGFFRGVDNAEEIRDIVRDRLRHHQDSGLGDPDDVGRPGGRGPRRGPGPTAATLHALKQVRAEAEALRRAAQGLG